MNITDRHLYINTLRPLLNARQMLFVTGPRQSGKTTLAKQIGGTFKDSLYLNWDLPDDRAAILRDPVFFTKMNRKSAGKPLVIFDEIHKKNSWKNYLKGCYDESSGDFKFLCTGSGRLDLFQKGSDSLAGRYFLFHLWPFTVAELAGVRRDFKSFYSNPFIDNLHDDDHIAGIWQRLREKSGFPDPYLSEIEPFYQLWSRTYRNQLIREDIRNATKIEKIDQMEALTYLLPNKVGSPISINNFAQDLGVAFETVKSWLLLLDRFFVTFRLKPFHKKIARSITKERKLYLFDYPQIEDPAARFENMIAVDLLRAITTWNECGHGPFDLFYVRNREKQEVDFLITERNRPWLLIEAKSGDTEPESSLLAIQKQLNVPTVQLVDKPGVLQFRKNANQRIQVCSADQWLSSLP